MALLIPVIMSGGVGSRLWPLSREAYPKQLVALSGPNTLLQESARRVGDPARFAPLMVIANAEHRFAVAEQLQAIGAPVARIVLEPVGRNTAPAAVVAALLAAETDPRAILLVTPADHHIPDVEAFGRAVDLGRPAAERGRFVLFGIQPTRPESGYGYLRLGPHFNGAGVREVAAFVEKPDRQTAAQFAASGNYLWNSGIFLLPAAAFLAEAEQLEPDLVEACRSAVAQSSADLDFMRLGPRAFASAKSISIDHAVMEKTRRALVVPATFPWNDIGAWSAVWEIGDKDGRGNVIAGAAVAMNARDCYVRSDGPLVAVSGVEDLIVVATADAVLVASKNDDQNVRSIVEHLKQNNYRVATESTRVHRPWGSYQSIHAGERFQVKCITVNPGAKLSLQKHYHRAEHWVVVTGTALVTRDGERIVLKENDSTFLPVGCVHRLENPGQIPLNITEVQSGSYLGEDDIVRLEDVYARQ
jgi:mannose-1-phosphate guanylyltransferase/mannose-1-phosphate guanylyltransferase/mannose-6-phosphate isomerase